MPQGPCWYRYNGDGYGEHKDGSAFDGTGIGRPWPLLAGERAHYGRMNSASSAPEFARLGIAFSFCLGYQAKLDRTGERRFKEAFGAKTSVYRRRGRIWTSFFLHLACWIASASEWQCPRVNTVRAASSMRPPFSVSQLVEKKSL